MDTQREVVMGTLHVGAMRSVITSPAMAEPPTPQMTTLWMPGTAPAREARDHSNWSGKELNWDKMSDGSVALIPTASSNISTIVSGNEGLVFDFRHALDMVIYQMSCSNAITNMLSLSRNQR
jgi:hypothetical protein